ncbi:MAG: NAD(P)H-binding protein, partial [Armatimonadetes bacterium]|nr:NAD(P)H-binding protein [Armatimonadota bacterium]
MPLVLLTGATGYVGGRLLRALEQSGMHVRCLARNPANLIPRVAPQTEVVAGDVLNFDSLEKAMDGVRTAFYMIHSMGSSSEFEELDRKGAENFARAAKEASVQRIIYLGGLGDNDGKLSSHLRSRHEVGDILRSSGVQTIEFRASVVIGSGSLSFEMIRALTERLPVMVTPKWVSALAQPIAITDVIAYLHSAVDLEIEGNRTFEIGGPDQLSYGDLMMEYALQRGFRRWMIRVPVLSPRLSSLWLGLVTPLYARVGRKLIDSIQHATTIRDTSAADAFAIRPMGVRDAMALALSNEDKEFAETRWSDPISSGGRPRSWGGVRFGNRLVDSR